MPCIFPISTIKSKKIVFFFQSRSTHCTTPSTVASVCNTKRVYSYVQQHIHKVKFVIFIEWGKHKRVHIKLALILCERNEMKCFVVVLCLLYTHTHTARTHTESETHFMYKKRKRWRRRWLTLSRRRPNRTVLCVNFFFFFVSSFVF